MKWSYQIYLPAIISLVFVIGMLFGYGLSNYPVAVDTEWSKKSSEKETLNEVLGLIDQNYYENKETSAFVDRAIYEMIEELDPYSMYIPPHHSEMLERSNSGKYVGIGIETLDVGEDVYISSVIKGGPADSIEVLKGSKIVSIDDINLHSRKWNSDSLSRYLRKDSSLPFTFVFDHFSYDASREVEVVPAEVKLPNISDALLLDADVGYIELSKFGVDSYKDFMGSLESLLMNDSLENLIIDVRNNPGGYLQEVCKMLSQFLPERMEFLSTVDADGNAYPYKSTGQSFFYLGNIIVLIDEESASASEILAGVLQDTDRAIIIGEKSYGKGLVQEQFELANGGTMRLSVSRYRLPSGRFIGKHDTTVFKTMRLQRDLAGTGSIVPDYEINHQFYTGNLDLFKSIILELNQDEREKQIELISEFPSENNAYQLEKQSILNGNLGNQKQRKLEDPLIQKSMKLIEVKDEWGVMF